MWNESVRVRILRAYQLRRKSSGDPFGKGIFFWPHSLMFSLFALIFLWAMGVTSKTSLHNATHCLGQQSLSEVVVTFENFREQNSTILCTLPPFHYTKYYSCRPQGRAFVLTLSGALSQPVPVGHVITKIVLQSFASGMETSGNDTFNVSLDLVCEL